MSWWFAKSDSERLHPAVKPTARNTKNSCRERAPTTGLSERVDDFLLLDGAKEVIQRHTSIGPLRQIHGRDVLTIHGFSASSHVEVLIFANMPVEAVAAPTAFKYWFIISTDSWEARRVSDLSAEKKLDLAIILPFVSKLGQPCRDSETRFGIASENLALKSQKMPTPAASQS